ncbi:MAG: hypothetical protein ABJO06_20775, partial [Roseibium sp.]|uniref:hypothetical protein n=1 Tax=Roseibium sp. TaxID=1936156 RepID=UPI003299AC71
MIEEISDQKARFEAKAALGQAQDQINGVLYDPDTGFMHSRGVNSVNGYDDTDKAIKKTVKDQGSSLSPQAKKYADEALKSLERNSSVQVGRHT